MKPVPWLAGPGGGSGEPPNAEASTCLSINMRTPALLDYGNQKYSKSKPLTQTARQIYSAENFQVSRLTGPSLTAGQPVRLDTDRRQPSSSPNERTTMTNVISLHDGQPQRPPGDPNPSLVEALERLLADAKAGTLQSFIGTGFAADGNRMSLFTWAHENVYEMLGAIAWLEHEYVNHITSEDGDD